MRTKYLYMWFIAMMMCLPMQLLAEKNYTHIDTPKISLGIDKQNEKPIKVTNTIAKNTKTIYASTYSHRAFADEKVNIKWYYYKSKKPILLKKESVDVAGYTFVYSRLEYKKGDFPRGRYKVVFQIGMGKPEIAYFHIVDAKSSVHKDRIWHYNISQFKAKSSQGKRVAIISIAIKKMQWNEKEKKLSLIVKADNQTYRDDYIFCSKKKSYYYCPIEDDGGYIKIDKDMNIQLNVEFSKETEEGLVSELSIIQKQKNRWIPPVSSKPKIQKDCSSFNKQEDKEMFFKVLKRYPELTIDDIKIHKPGRYYDAKHGVSIVAPQGWNPITKYDDNILYLKKVKDGSMSKFMLKSLAKFWDDEQSKEPKKIIKKAARIIAEISTEEAVKNGDKMQKMGSLKLFKQSAYTIGHFVLHRIGKKSRWESYTLIWEGKHLYILAVTSRENDLLLGEFLSSLGMESFCSEISRRK